MVIIFIGPPGSGKGTQAQVLKESVLPNLHILTVSSLLKEKSSDGSILGNKIKQKMDDGDLIEDSVVISVLKEKANSLENEQILVDGFPRSSIQADSLSVIFYNKKLNIFNFIVTDEELLVRIKKRSQEESRADDSVFDKRLSIYKKTHDEIIESLSKNNEVINIDANHEIESISQKIIEKLDLN
tara:strand:+ start:937 stop:1491 length:555 start_codon:yes stop_codon:yes gene_type:complete